MKKILIMTVLLILLSVAVSAALRICGNGICDDWPGNQADPQETCNNCPADCICDCGDGYCDLEGDEHCTTCPEDCICKGGCSYDYGEEEWVCEGGYEEPGAEGPFNIYDALLGQEISENILLNNEIFLSRVIKDQTFQLDIKNIEIIWQHAFIENFEGDDNINCEILPVSLLLSKNDYYFGKRDEASALLDLLAVILQDEELRESLGVTSEQYSTFEESKIKAETHLSEEEFLKAAQYMCCAYNSLKHNLVLDGDGNPPCRPPPPPPPPPTGGGGGGKFVDVRIPCCNFDDIEYLGMYYTGTCCPPDPEKEKDAYVEFKKLGCCDKPWQPECKKFCPSIETTAIEAPTPTIPTPVVEKPTPPLAKEELPAPPAPGTLKGAEGEIIRGKTTEEMTTSDKALMVAAILGVVALGAMTVLTLIHKKIKHGAFLEKAKKRVEKPEKSKRLFRPSKKKKSKHKKKR